MYISGFIRSYGRGSAVATTSNRENVGINSGNYRGTFPSRIATDSGEGHLAILPAARTSFYPLELPFFSVLCLAVVHAE